MSNREKRIHTDFVHVLMGLARPCHGEASNCVRIVDKGYGNEIDILEAKLKVLGGYFRIHRTVNARCVKTAMKHLMCNLINHPEKASYIDSEWRTALLQKHCIYGQKKFMLDIDTQNEDKLEIIESLIPKTISEVNKVEIIVEKIKSPKGWHYITLPFDTRQVCELPYVDLVRDGYYFIKEVGKRII